MNSNGQQVQQFYDPIQQQYYTITQQPNQGPQPQYFPASPQPQQFTASSPQPNGYFFIQPGQQQPQAPAPVQDHAFGGNLPYPTEHHEDGDTQVSANQVNGDTQVNVSEENGVANTSEATEVANGEATASAENGNAKENGTKETSHPGQAKENEP